MSPNPIQGKIMLQGVLECQSPLHIGSGSNTRSDMDILLDDEGKPFIPATSIVGVLRHAIKPDANDFKPDANDFWGYTNENDGRQSALCCSDLVCQTESPITTIRDGIEIDNATGIVKEQSKYDFEVVERGTRFLLHMELSYRDSDSDKEFVRRMAATIHHVLRDKKITLGAKTMNGLGAIRLLEESTHIYEFDFSSKSNPDNSKSDVLYWLKQDFSAKQPIDVETLGTPFAITSDNFSINASFWLKNSLIVRSYSADPNDPDATHITSGDDLILPGTSLKGAIRARAERIVNTLDKPQEILENLFGYVIEKKDKKEKSQKPDKKKAKIHVKETVLPKFVSNMQVLASEIQTRIKIDRFTGGTIESALFDTMPVFSSGTKPANADPKELINLQIHVRDCQEHEAGLLLLVLKDLWTGDLAVGGEKNVGRGVFQGVQAKIAWNGQELCTLPEHVQDVTEDQKETLNAYAKALNDYNTTTTD